MDRDVWRSVPLFFEMLSDRIAQQDKGDEDTS